MAEQANPNGRVDPRSGKLIKWTPPEEMAIPPDPKTVTDIYKVAGKNPPVQNLRDHPEWSGMDIIVTDVAFGDGTQKDGRQTEYAICQAFISPPGKKPTKDNFVLLRTGADNFYKRVCAAFAANALPVHGTLRLGGRAWFLD